MNMKRWILFLPLFAGFVCFYLNADESLHGNSREADGIVVTAAKMFTINDHEPEKFYFRRPKNLAVDRDEKIYVMDRRQLLQFSPTGELIQNMATFGQGPGETTFLADYQICDTTVILFNAYPSKIVWKERESGKFVREKRIDFNGKLDYLFRFQETGDNAEIFAFKTRHIPGMKKIPGVVDAVDGFISVSAEGMLLRKNIYSFPSQLLVAKYPSGDLATSEISNFQTCLKDNKSFYFVDSFKYQIKLCDMERGLVAAIKPRPQSYRSVKITKKNKKYAQKDRLSINGKWYNPPLPEHFQDIMGMFKNNGQLWVLTSTIDEDKGVLVDVYDNRENYVRQFYLKLPEHINPYYLATAPMTIHKDCLYLVERSQYPEYAYSISKYRLVGEQVIREAVLKNHPF
jgi:hypothetical protein